MAAPTLAMRRSAWSPVYGLRSVFDLRRSLRENRLESEAEDDGVSLIPNARIEHAVDEIGEQVHADVRDGDEQDAPCTIG